MPGTQSAISTYLLKEGVITIHIWKLAEKDHLTGFDALDQICIVEYGFDHKTGAEENRTHII